MNYAEYKKLLEKGNKICFKCENGQHSKKYKYFTHGYNAVFWLCSSCLKELGSTNKVMEYLEAVPIPYDCLNYSSAQSVELQKEYAGPTGEEIRSSNSLRPGAKSPGPQKNVGGVKQ